MSHERKRLFFDIETSPNIVLSWRTGYQITIDHDNILSERAIICICWKWEHEEDIRSLTWSKKHDDRKMLVEFSKVINQATEVIGHNSDKFDIKWFNTRCLYHRIHICPEIRSIDTLKIARSKFYFNSNRLDYIAKFLGIGGKMDTGGFGLWKAIVLDKCSESLAKMVEYCKRDVQILESVYNELKSFAKPKTHYGVLMGGESYSCPECGHDRPKVSKTRVLPSGITQKQMLCKNSKCERYFTISNRAYQKLLDDRIAGEHS